MREQARRIRLIPNRICDLFATATFAWVTRDSARTDSPHFALVAPLRPLATRWPTSRPWRWGVPPPPRIGARTAQTNSVSKRGCSRGRRLSILAGKYLLTPSLPRSDSGCKAPGRRCLAHQLHARTGASMACDPHAARPLRRTGCAPVAPAPARGGLAQQVGKRGGVVVCSMISRSSRDEPVARKRLQ